MNEPYNANPIRDSNNEQVLSKKASIPKESLGVLASFGINGIWAAVILFFFKSLAGVLFVAFVFNGWANLKSVEMDFSVSAIKLRISREKNIGKPFSNEAVADQITSLPGLTFAPPFLQFSGYLDISPSKHNFYWFTESEQNPEKDPLLFWTNGGPGCSGLNGFLTEMGAYRPQETLLLQPNSMAWNKLANIVYIEQPCGVGFSYSDNPNYDYVTSDDQAAADNLQLILKFLERFPHLKKNKIYLGAESYGGHYLPTWSMKIVEYNEMAAADAKINFSGFLVGNPYTNPSENLLGRVGTYWGHQLIPRDLSEKWGALGCFGNPENNLDECAEIENTMFEVVDEIDPYALDYEVCNKAQQNKLTSYIHDGRFQSKNEIEGPVDAEPVYQPCITSYMTKWINQPSVKAAIHAQENIQWEQCSEKLFYREEDSMTPMDPVYQELIGKNLGLNIMIFSGDDDSVCGTMGTQSWMWRLGYPVLKQWAPWHHNGQVAGFELRFDGLRFVTVHGAGHEVPAFKPGPSLQLFQAFLEDVELEDIQEKHNFQKKKLKH